MKPISQRFVVSRKVTFASAAFFNIAIFSAAAAAQGPALFPVEEWPIGTSPNVVKAGDFNGDGKVDFLANNYNGASIGVSFGDGAGRFAAPIFYAIGNFPVWLDMGDVNNDGIADCVTCNLEANAGISAILGNGTGGFSAPIKSLLVVNMKSIAVGDFTNDGKADAVITHVNSNITMAAGDGLGGFVATTTPAANTYYDVAVGDWNGDGKLDAAMPANGANLVAIFFGNGAGNLAPAQNITSLVLANNITSRDLDGDGKADLLVSTLANNSLASLLNNGSGTFVLHGTYSAGYDPRGAALADVNHDSKIDAVVANFNSSSGAAILLGDGAGGFGTFVKIPTAAGALTTAIADANNDSHPDIFISNASAGSVSVRLGDGTGAFSGAHNIPTGGQHVQILVSDLNRDGKLDYLTVNPTVNNSIASRLGDGAGGFGSIINSTDMGFAALGDYNGDSYPDFIATKASANRLILKLGNGAGGFGAASETTVNNILDFASADINLDGNLDAVVGRNLIFNYLLVSYLGNGAGGFSAPITTTTTTGVGKLGLGDFNNDGVPDAVAAAGFSISTYLGNGAGGFGTIFTLTGLQGQTASSPAVADVNFDGNLDVALGAGQNIFPANARVIRGNGDGTLTSIISYTVPQVAQSVALADVTGDGYKDLIAAIPSSNNVYVWPGDGTFTFGARRDFGTGSNPLAMAVADVNHDGHLDILTVNNVSQDVTLLTNLSAVPNGILLYGIGTPGCGGVHGIEATTSPNLNTPQFAIVNTNVPPSSLGLVLLTDVQDIPGTDIFNLGILIHAGIAGANDILLFDIVSDNTGYAALPAGVANDPNLLNRTFYAQSIWYDLLCNYTWSHFSSSRGIGITVLP